MPLELNEEAWTDFQILLNSYLDASEKLLQRDKFLIPMAMGFQNNEPGFIALQPDGADDIVDTKTHLIAYRKLLRSIPTNKRACILGYDIRVNHESYTDAIAIELEHANGTHQKMFVPYKFTGFRKSKLEMGQSKLTDPETEHILHRS